MKPSHVLRRNAMRLRAQVARMNDPLVVDVATAIAKAYDDLADLQDLNCRRPASRFEKRPKQLDLSPKT